MRCECGTEYEGNFCPHCGKKGHNGTEKKKSKKWFRGIAIVILAAAAFHVANPGSKTHEQKMKINELNSQLSDTVTEDWLPGTYVTENGEVFAINVEDEAIFDINVTLTNIFKGKDWTMCSVILPDNGGLEESAILDLGDESIQLSGTDLVYTYKQSKKELTLTTPEDEKILCLKISDEYNADIFTGSVDTSFDDVVGTYESADSNALTTDIIQIEKQDDNTMNIYWCVVENDSDKGYYIRGLAEQVPLDAFAQNVYVCLIGEDVLDTHCISFVNREGIIVEGKMSGYFRTDREIDLQAPIEEYKKEHSDVNYQYSAYSEDIDILFTKMYDSAFSFNRNWYKQYTHFSGSNIPLDIKEQGDETVQIRINGSEYRTFNVFDYAAGDDSSYVVYTCEDGTQFDYYPQYNTSLTSGTSYVPMIRFHQLDEGICEESYYTEYGMDFEYTEP